MTAIFPGATQLAMSIDTNSSTCEWNQNNFEFWNNMSNFSVDYNPVVLPSLEPKQHLKARF